MTLPNFSSTAGLWATGGPIVTALCAVARSVVLARMLDAAPLGRVFLMLSAASVVAAFGQAGLGVVGLKRIAAADNEETVAETLRSVFDLTLAANGALVAVAALLLFSTGMPAWQVASFALLLTAQLWIGLLAALVRGQQRVTRAIVHEQVLAPVAQVMVLPAWAAIGGAASVARVLALLAAALVPSIAVLAASLRNAWRPIPAGAVRSRRRILDDAMPVVGTAMLWRGAADVPLWTAAAVTGEAGAAVFAVAQRLSAVVSLPLAGTGAVLAPRAAARLARGEHELLEAELRRGARTAGLGAAFFLGVLIIAGDPILSAAYGREFAVAVPIAAVLGLGHVVNAAGGIGAFMLISMNESRRLLRLSAAVTAGMALMVFPLGLSFGLIGPAYGWLIAVVFQNLGMIRAVRRLSGIRVYAG